jgi:hypothetical protein
VQALSATMTGSGQTGIGRAGRDPQIQSWSSSLLKNSQFEHIDGILDISRL